MLLISTLAAFILTTAVLLSGYFLLTADSPVEQRLRTVVPEGVARRREALQERQRLGFMSRVLTFVGSLAAGNNDRSLTQTLTTAGFRSSNALFVFVGARTMLSVGSALLYLVPRISRG